MDQDLLYEDPKLTCYEESAIMATLNSKLNYEDAKILEIYKKWTHY